MLELTESVAVDAAGRHGAQLDELRATGVRLAIDDFGTGYSSLSQLGTLPVDVLKVDRSFTDAITSGEAPILLEAVVKLGNALGIEVIAEGVENAAPGRSAATHRLPAGPGVPPGPPGHGARCRPLPAER